MLSGFDLASLGAIVAASLFAGILLCLRLGRMLGERAIARHGPEGHGSVGSLETAIFALLGLLVAFTFSGGLERFDARRGQVVDEANAIGTAWLRVDLVPAAAQPALREQFRRYVDSRIATYRKLPDLAAANAEYLRSQELQAEIWRSSLAAVRLPEAKPSAEMLLVPALNQMFDITTTRVAATRTHPPPIVYAMLVMLAFAAALLAGYQAAGVRGYTWIHKLGFAAIFALTVYVILDIEFPRFGWVRVDAIDQLLVDLRASMGPSR